MPNSLSSLLVIVMLMTACDSERQADSTTQARKLIVCTTGMIADMARSLTDQQIDVVALMGPGVDPHLYKATQGDLKLLRDADLIIYNGHHLEGKMADVLEGIKAQGRYALALAECLKDDELIEADGRGTIDPHIWFDVELWSSTSHCMENALIEAQLGKEEHIAARGDSLRDAWDRLDSQVSNWMQEIPEGKRVLVTAHDAFAYYGRAYGVEVLGLQGISTISEAGLKDITQMVDFLIERNIPAVFIESSVSPRDIEAVVAACQAKGHVLKVGATLYSDAMGATGSPEANYDGMVRYNAQQIRDGLR